MTGRIWSIVYLVGALLLAPSVVLAGKKDNPMWKFHSPVAAGKIAQCDRAEPYKWSAKGKLAFCTLGEAELFHITPSGVQAICMADKQATFNDDGYLAKCTLSSDFKFKAGTSTSPPEYVKQPLCKQGQTAAFDTKNGALLKCQ